MKVAEALLEEKVITVPGAAFGSESEGFLACFVLCGAWKC